MILKLASTDSVASVFLRELRDRDVQKDALRFRTNLRRLGYVLGYEVSKYLIYKSKITQTPLGEFAGVEIDDSIVIATILRAGLPLHEGVLNCFDHAENAFITAYRKYHKTGDFVVKFEYIASPNLDGKILILCDPMLATGASIIGTLKELKSFGIPKATYILGVIASRDAVDAIKEYDEKLNIIVGDIDEELTAKGYIIPGLGDAGDLAYGKKNDH